MATIIFNDNLNVLNLSEYHTENIIVTYIQGQNHEHYNINTYIPPENQGMEIFLDILKQIEHILIELKIFNKAIFISGDFNSRPKTWGDKETNRRGKLLLEFITNHGLIILNEGDIPTFEGPNGNSFIDLTLVNEKFYEHNIIREIDRETELLTDHNPIITRLTYHGENINNNTRYNFGKADWGQFKTEIHISSNEILEKINKVGNANQLDNEINALTETVIKICDKTRPKIIYNKNKTNFWNTNLENYKQKLKKLRK